MKNIVLNNFEYEIIENKKDCIDLEKLESLFTDYFYDFDYILGDYSYNMLRLKGFYDSKNKKVKKINDISNYKDYINNFCATECSFFLIKKKNSIEKK